MSKYINPFLDWSFKHIFGRDSVKDILIGFLNALFAGRHVIVDIDFGNSERQPEDQQGRAIIYDIFCTTDRGERIIVEMQNREQPYFKDRALYYMARSVAEQGVAGHWDYRLDAVYGIFFLNFRLEDVLGKDTGGSLTEVALVDTATGAIFNPKFQQYYIELPRFDKTERECVSEYDKWIYVLKHMDTLEAMPFADDRNAIFARLEETASRANLTREERALYEEQWKNYNDYYNTIDFAEDKGKREGYAEGRADGREEGRAEGRIEGRIEGREEGRAEGEKRKSIDIARNMKMQGCQTDLIAVCTGLTAEEIDRL